MVAQTYPTGKWRTNIDGGNQAKVIHIVEALLETKHQDLQCNFRILPITTCAGAGGIGKVEDGWLTQDLDYITKFLGQGSCVVLGWVNQNTSWNPKARFAIGGGISKQLTDEQTSKIQDTLSKLAKIYQEENPKQKESARTPDLLSDLANFPSKNPLPQNRPCLEVKDSKKLSIDKSKKHLILMLGTILSAAIILTSLAFSGVILTFGTLIGSLAAAYVITAIAVLAATGALAYASFTLYKKSRDKLTISQEKKHPPNLRLKTLCNSSSFNKLSKQPQNIIIQINQKKCDLYTSIEDKKQNNEVECNTSNLTL